MRDLTHYYKSCAWNYHIFNGFKWEPVCSRVYRNRSIWFAPFRFAFIKLTNYKFNEPAHCERIHLIFLMQDFPD